MFSDIILSKVKECNENIAIEIFPNKSRIKPGKFGQILKLPYGYHVKTGEQSYFYNENMEKELQINIFLDSIAKFSLTAIKKILASNAGTNEIQHNKIVDEDISVLEETGENIIKILQQCNLMRYLCLKAYKTSYLNHFERLSLLYVFGHLGEEGKEFVHKVMSYTLNYQYNITEKFIRRLPDKPISCIKLRDQYKRITAEYGCNCVFKRTKNCYPSPVLHAISLSGDDNKEITLPTSRTLSKDKEQLVMDEMNIHKKVQDLAKKILDTKKQKRGLDAAITKMERELEKIYDNAGVDCVETEIGILIRRKKDEGYEWIIEL